MIVYAVYDEQELVNQALQEKNYAQLRELRIFAIVSDEEGRFQFDGKILTSVHLALVEAIGWNYLGTEWDARVKVPHCEEIPASALIEAYPEGFRLEPEFVGMIYSVVGNGHETPSWVRYDGK